eukprot:s571_g11.t1
MTTCPKELSASNVVLLSNGDAARMASFEVKAAAELGRELNEPFLAVRSVGMVGLVVSVFVAQRLAPSIRAVSGDRIRSGLYGQAGNKGAVVVTFKVKKAQERAEQLREILQSLCPEKGTRPDLLVISGDFNFRAQLPENTRATLSNGWLDPTAVGQLGEGAMSTSDEVKRLFFQCDEMHCAGRSRQELHEILKEIKLGTEWHGCDMRRSSFNGYVHGYVARLDRQAAYDLEREPAWCDRVLHSKVSVQRKSYCALGGLMESDHRPVSALLETLLLAMPQRTPVPSESPTSDLPDLLEMTAETHQVEQSTPQSSTQVPVEELLDLDASPITPAPAPASTPAPTPAPASAPTATTAPTTTHMGQLVYAKYQDGWYLANVIRPGGHTVDVAWLRPQGAIWGDKAQMAQYLCSTNADETLHGDQLPVATHIRLASDFQSGSDLIDLLGHSQSRWPAVQIKMDVKIRDLSSTAAQKIFQDKLAEPLIDAIGEYFELPKGDVSVDDAFIVRYATDSQRGLAFHRDGSIVSAIISLSDERDYVGGGTQFMDGSVYRPSQGGGILFGGQRLHGGVDITRGARYICTIFFKCGGLSCRDLAVLKDKEEEGDPGIWGAIADVLGVGK